MDQQQSIAPRPVEPRQLRFADDGSTPNSVLPVLLYAMQWPHGRDRAAAFEALFEVHGWPALWRDGVFPYHHFHPNAHEVLGIAKGEARLTLGGTAGQTLSVKAGDVLVLPAGTGHRCVTCSDDFLVVGGYPRGQEDYEVERPSSRGHAQAVARIAKVALPELDPVLGKEGGVVALWR